MLLVDRLHVHGVVNAGLGAAAATLFILAFLLLLEFDILTCGPFVIAKVSTRKLKVSALLDKLLLRS